MNGWSNIHLNLLDISLLGNFIWNKSLNMPVYLKFSNTKLTLITWGHKVNNVQSLHSSIPLVFQQKQNILKCFMYEVGEVMKNSRETKRNDREWWNLHASLCKFAFLKSHVKINDLYNQLANDCIKNNYLSKMQKVMKNLSLVSSILFITN